MSKVFLILFISYICGKINAQTVQCKIELYTIKNNEKFCHQLVLVRGRVVCPTLQPSYPNDLNPSVGRFITVRKSDGSTKNWPINSYHDFKALIRLKKGNNTITLSYNYVRAKTEKASLSINLVYGENMQMEPLRLGMFVAKDSERKFDMDKESLANGEKNDYDSAVKRMRMAALLWQALTSDSLNSYGLPRKSFRLELDSNGGKIIISI